LFQCGGSHTRFLGESLRECILAASASENKSTTQP
jgi:hypothetical protein